MADRIASDHGSVATVRATIERAGGPRHLGVAVPADELDPPVGEPIRLVLDETERHAVFDRRHDRAVLTGAYDTPDAARNPDGATNRLRAWIRETGLEAGRSVLVDEVVPGFRYGLRRPGTSTVYDASRPPRQSLRDVAADLKDD